MIDSCDPYQEHINALCKKEIELDEFERRCKEAWIELNGGPPPDGRELVVGVLDGALVVGHTEIRPEEPMPTMVWKFERKKAVDVT